MTFLRVRKGKRHAQAHTEGTHSGPLRLRRGTGGGWGGSAWVKREPPDRWWPQSPVGVCPAQNSQIVIWTELEDVPFSGTSRRQ